MRVIVAAKRADARTFLHLAADAGGFEVYAVESTQELASELFRDNEAIGVLASEALLALHAVREIRRADVVNPLFVITYSNLVTVTVKCLLAGCDDVQPWPIDAIEYVARLAALARRERSIAGEFVQLPNCRYFPMRGVIDHPGGTVMFSRIEAEIFNMLVLKPDITFSREMLMARLYGGRDEPQPKVLDVFICKLRKKLAGPTGGVDVIETVWGRGYRAVVDGFTPAAEPRESRARASA